MTAVIGTPVFLWRPAFARRVWSGSRVLPSRSWRSATASGLSVPELASPSGLVRFCACSAPTVAAKRRCSRRSSAYGRHAPAACSSMATTLAVGNASACDGVRLRAAGLCRAISLQRARDGVDGAHRPPEPLRRAVGMDHSAAAEALDRLDIGPLAESDWLRISGGGAATGADRAGADPSTAHAGTQPTDRQPRLC